jgi:flagellar hook-associated protein 3 FlgL
MPVDRIATNTQAHYLLSQIMNANAALDTTQAQVASGKVSTNYVGIGDKTAALEAARAAAARADAYASNTQLAVTQTDLQNTQLTALSSLAGQLKQAITSAAGNSDGANLMATADDIFQQASAILNSTDSSGNYIYGGGQGDAKPFTATSLSDLAGGSVSNFFQNGTQKKSVLVGDLQSVQIGVLASDVGSQLMTALRNLAGADSPTGSLDGSLTNAQAADLTDNVLPSATKAYTDLNAATAVNGDTYRRLGDAVANQQSLSTLYKGFVSDIEDVDMTQAVTRLNQNQVALQAALAVTAKLGQLSLLNYLPTTTTTG